MQCEALYTFWCRTHRAGYWTEASPAVQPWRCMCVKRHVPNMWWRTHVLSAFRNICVAHLFSKGEILTSLLESLGNHRIEKCRLAGMACPCGDGALARHFVVVMTVAAIFVIGGTVDRLVWLSLRKHVRHCLSFTHAQCAFIPFAYNCMLTSGFVFSAL